MSYYLTEETCRIDGDPPSENRVVGLDAFTFSCTWSTWSQTPDTHPEIETTDTTTVSGILSWLSRDPIGEESFFVQYTKDKSLFLIFQLFHQSYAPCYLFVQNTPNVLFDAFGLAPVMGGCNEEQKAVLRKCLGISDEEAKKCDDETEEMCDGLSDAMKGMMLAPIRGGKICKFLKAILGKIWKETDPGEDLPPEDPDESSKCDDDDECKYEKE